MQYIPQCQSLCLGTRYFRAELDDSCPLLKVLALSCVEHLDQLGDKLIQRFFHAILQTLIGIRLQLDAAKFWEEFGSNREMQRTRLRNPRRYWNSSAAPVVIGFARRAGITDGFGNPGFPTYLKEMGAGK